QLLQVEPGQAHVVPVVETLVGQSAALEGRDEVVVIHRAPPSADGSPWHPGPGRRPSSGPRSAGATPPRTALCPQRRGARSPPEGHPERSRSTPPAHSRLSTDASQSARRSAPARRPGDRQSCLLPSSPSLLLVPWYHGRMGLRTTTIFLYPPSPGGTG